MAPLRSQCGIQGGWHTHLNERPVGMCVCVCVDMCKMSGELTVANLDEASPCRQSR